MDTETPADRPSPRLASPRLVPFPSVPRRDGEPASALPLPRTPLVGRERELTTLEALLRHDDVPLVTLTGPTGVGNTWFALAAAEVAETFPDKVRFVGLALISISVLVVPGDRPHLRSPGVGSGETARSAIPRPRSTCDRSLEDLAESRSN